MSRKKRVFSNIDDSSLLEIINEEFKRNPEGFSSLPLKEGLITSASFLQNSSGKTIPQLSKWL